MRKMRPILSHSVPCTVTYDRIRLAMRDLQRSYFHPPAGRAARTACPEQRRVVSTSRADLTPFHRVDTNFSLAVE